MTRKKILHAAYEYHKRVGGIGSVTTGLTPALAKKGFDVSIVTPFFDVYDDYYKDKDLKQVTTLTHIYKGVPVKSKLFRVCSEIVDGEPVYHYLIKPMENTPQAKLFDTNKQETNIYQGESGNRREYFNGAVAAMLRLPDDNVPQFDIYHSHAWHTGIAAVLAKEFENLPKWRALNKDTKKPLKKIPHMISTIHMLLPTEHGQITQAAKIAELLDSIGLPSDFAQKFTRWKEYINPGHLKQVALVLLYSDAVTTVSEGLAHEASHVKGGGQGLDDLFIHLEKQGRLQGILNGIDYKKFDATSTKNLSHFALDPEHITDGKKRLKEYLASKFPKLDPNKMWFGMVSRFAAEKGMDMLPTAIEAIAKEDGMFILMGWHVAFVMKDGKLVPRYKEEIDAIRNHPNVLVIDDPEIQKLFGKEIRAATDCTVLLSHNEACGLPPMEGFAAASFALGPRRQGVPDSTIDLGVHPDHGTGFLYNDDPETRHSNLKHGVHRAAKFYREQTAAGTLDKFLQRVQHQSKRLDWSATPANKYTELYNKVTKRALLTYDRIRNAFKPMLHLFKNVTRHRDATIKATKVLPTSEVTKPSLIPDTKKGKIFQIGFNKCGTQMLYYAFTENGVPSAHYAAANRPIADTMHENAKSNKPLLHGIDNFEAYFDFEDIYHSPPLYPALTHFKLLDQQYKGSRFILNTRNPEDWITSRLSHKDPITKQKYSEILCDKYGCNLDTLIQRWRKEWDEHHKAVREYFKDRPNDLLEFNIDTDSPQKVCDFFKDKKLDPTVFKVVNKTHDKENALSNTQLVMPRPALSF